MTDKRKKIDWGDVWNRTWKTFLQGFFSAVIVTPAIFANVKDIDGLWKVLYPILIAGVAGGICAVWNLAKDYFSKEEE